MPDITMCDSESCKVRGSCYRNPASGTKPNEFRQSWFFIAQGDDETCVDYWSMENGEKDES
jgi:hypothetical protein